LIPAGLVDRLEVRYGEPQRHYHTWAHISALKRHYDRLAPYLARPAAVLWALYWHDAIYDPMAKDNEEQSAVLLEADAAGHLPAEDIAFAAMIIRATAKHLVPDGLLPDDEADLSLFLDMDLSILAAPAADFDQYERDVRAEYAAVPDDAFRKGRAAILKNFLDRPRLYFTNICAAHWEAPARDNLARSITALEADA
jgi:predicted metal-dependent HD superfamily phosphohydrolase